MLDSAGEIDATNKDGAETLAAELGLASKDSKQHQAVVKTITSLQKTYRSLPFKVQSHVLHQAVEYAIALLPKLAHLQELSSPGTLSPLQLYERAVDRDLYERSTYVNSRKQMGAPTPPPL